MGGGRGGWKWEGGVEPERDVTGNGWVEVGRGGRK